MTRLMAGLGIVVSLLGGYLLVLAVGVLGAAVLRTAGHSAVVRALLGLLVIEHAALLGLGAWLAWRFTRFVQAVRDDPGAAEVEAAFLADQGIHASLGGRPGR